MSIRHYTPRRRRHGISQRARLALGAALALTILLQISYPLINGAALDFLTIATVYVGAIAMLLHAYLSFGAKYFARYLLLTVLFGYFIEFLGVHTGWPFGIYSYDDSLGPDIFDVPIVVPFAWVMMVHPALVAARRVTKKWTFIYGGAILATWDLFLDPQMVDAGRWTLGSNWLTHSLCKRSSSLQFLRMAASRMCNRGSTESGSSFRAPQGECKCSGGNTFTFLGSFLWDCRKSLLLRSPRACPARRFIFRSLRDSFYL